MKELNLRLKEVKTFNQFKELEKEVNTNPNGLLFRTKKAKWIVFDFTEDNGYVDYLINDGIHRGRCKIENIYRIIEISDNGR